MNIKKNTAERICFTDYGCAYYKNKKKEECTTLIYSSPELLKKIFYDDKIIINKKSDIFSLGIILYQIYNLNEHPFDSNNFEIQMKIPIKDYEIIDSINNKFLANLVLSMLQYAKKRPSATELLKIIDNYCKKNTEFQIYK